MNDDNTGGPAFPLFGVTVVEQKGMTMRDYFAAKALAALLGNLNGDKVGFKGSIAPLLAELAYQQADAMLAERHK